MSLNLKVLAIAAFAAGSTFAASPDFAAAQGNSGRGSSSGQWEKDKKESKDKKKPTVRRDDDRRDVVLSRREQEARARAAREQVIRERQKQQRDAERVRDDRNRVQARNAKAAKKGTGPAFCRSGAGHPVHGRSWCLDKGFGIGNDRWDQGTWGDVVFDRSSSRSGTVSGGTLADIVGRVVYGRLQTQSARLGGGPITGRWLTSSTGPLVLQVQSGNRPIAEFVDRNRDGRSDALFLNLGR